MLNGIHSRGYLPHVTLEGAAYFVTFRLADSLPAELRAQLAARRHDLEQRVDGAKAAGSLGAFECQIHEIDDLLDRNSGSSWLRRADIADVVARALRHFEGQRYRLFAWVVMPNHVHAVLRPLGSHALSAILHSWKSFTGTAANRRLDRSGEPFWQPESYDHGIRDDAELTQCCSYTEQNPVKAGLCRSASEWSWSSAWRQL